MPEKMVQNELINYLDLRLYMRYKIPGAEDASYTSLKIEDDTDYVYFEYIYKTIAKFILHSLAKETTFKFKLVEFRNYITKTSYKENNDSTIYYFLLVIDVLFSESVSYYSAKHWKFIN